MPFYKVVSAFSTRTGGGYIHSGQCVELTKEEAVSLQEHVVEIPQSEYEQSLNVSKQPEQVEVNLLQDSYEDVIDVDNRRLQLEALTAEKLKTLAEEKGIEFVDKESAIAALLAQEGSGLLPDIAPLLEARKAELEAMPTNELKAFAKEQGITYQSKPQAIADILAKEGLKEGATDNP